MTTLILFLCMWTNAQNPNYPWEYANLPDSFLNTQWNGQEFVAMDWSFGLAAIYTSPDGQRWTPNRFPYDHFWLYATNGNNELILTLEGAAYQRTQSGQYEQIGSVSVTDPHQLLWHDNRWLLLDKTTLYASQDGAQWDKILDLDGYSVINMAAHDGVIGIATFEGYLSLDGEDQEQLLLRDITVQNGQFFAPGLHDNLLYRSQDGKTWASVLTPRKGSVWDLYYANGIYVAVGDEGLLASSTDGVNWTERTGAGSALLSEVTWFDGRFYTVGEELWSSTNGISWSLVADVDFAFGSRLIPSDQALLLMHGEPSERRLYKDGQWSHPPSGINLGLEVLNDIILLATDKGLFRSSDGRTWQMVGPPNLLLTRTQEQFVVFGPDSVQTSSDGLTWESQAGTKRQRRVIWEHDRFWMLAYNQNSYSFDGHTWEPLPMTSQLHDVARYGNDFWLVGDEGVWRSGDGQDWEKQENHSGATQVLVDGDLILIAGYSGLSSSNDGGNIWVPRHNERIRALVKWQDHYVAMGDNQVLASVDGQGWKRQSQLAPLGLERLVARGDELLALDIYGLGFASWQLDTDLEPGLPQQIIPWVVSNETWYSKLAIFNHGQTPTEVQLRATDREGTVMTETLLIPATGVWAQDAATLFPGLNGYSIQIYSQGNVYASYLTFNDGEGGKHAPSQTVAAEVPALTDKLSFAYVPGQDVPAVVLVNTQPEATTTTVSFSLVDASGLELGLETRSLTGNQPLAILVSELFEMDLPDHAAVHVTGPSGSLLAGTTFVFNTLGQPSMSRAHSVYNP